MYFANTPTPLISLLYYPRILNPLCFLFFLTHQVEFVLPECWALDTCLPLEHDGSTMDCTFQENLLSREGDSRCWLPRTPYLGVGLRAHRSYPCWDWSGPSLYRFVKTVTPYVHIYNCPTVNRKTLFPFSHPPILPLTLYLSPPLPISLTHGRRECITGISIWPLKPWRFQNGIVKCPSIFMPDFVVGGVWSWWW